MTDEPAEHLKQWMRKMRKEGVVKVLLRIDVDGLGRTGDIVDVARGYARNYLVPRGLAIEALRVWRPKPRPCSASALEGSEDRSDAELAAPRSPAWCSR
ncbi:MAG: hypothetical protein Ct9H300mP31_00250 [Acidimicrobiaceae bacterium]|nr:MAG: hypothetical protein Ct9H300mP31_00250 [Acidimicrobiaceae bacterium]